MVYEYKVLRFKSDKLNKVQTELNNEAENGWRLISTDQINGFTTIYLERKK